MSEILFERAVEEIRVTIHEDGFVMVTWPGVHVRFTMNEDGELRRPKVIAGNPSDVDRARKAANKAISWRPKGKDMIWGRFAPADS